MSDSQPLTPDPAAAPAHAPGNDPKLAIRVIAMVAAHFPLDPIGHGITLATTFDDEFLDDACHRYNLLGDCQIEFAIDLSDEDVDQCKTVADFVSLIAKGGSH